MIVNKNFWDKLPADIRSALEKAMAEATTYANNISEQENEYAIAEMKKSGKTTFYELTAQEQSAWHKALEPVTQEMASRVGKGLITEFQNETRSATN